MGRPKSFDREKFLQKTTLLFWQKGFTVAGLSEILEASEVSKSSLYSEFQDKEDIFNECIKYYRAENQSLNILSAKPLGWKNIEAFLKSAALAKGQKGCFFANSVREFNAIPVDARKEISEHAKACHHLLVDNIKATKTKKNADLLASAILTFSSGVALKLNAVKPADLLPEIDIYMEMLKA